jgi:hypothetical protein
VEGVRGIVQATAPIGESAFARTAIGGWGQSRSSTLLHRTRKSVMSPSMAEVNSDSAARLQRRGRLERFSRNERIFPGGDHETGHCTGCARIIVGRFGGEVRGYWHDDNPTAQVGETEGGHNFAVTADRFLVDPWLYHY